MRSFKKIILPSLLFFLLTGLISTVAIGTFFMTETGYYQDIKYRDQLKGTIDCFLIGSSRELCGFVPEIVNQNTEYNCYNLSGSAMSPSNKILMLEEEIDRNPVKTVIIGVGDDDLNYQAKQANAEGEIALIPRIRSVKKRLSILKNYVLPEDYAYIYAVYMNEGTKTFTKLIAGKYESAVDAEALGWHAKESKNIRISDEKIYTSYRCSEADFETPGNRERLYDLIDLCKSRGIEVILVSFPVSESKIWPIKNYDELYNIYCSIAQEYKCPFIDLNLLKNRKDLFSDKYSFTDVDHMSTEGAETATKLTCDIINKIHSGEDVSDMFYSSYDEAIKHFEYYEIYQKLIQEQK